MPSNKRINKPTNLEEYKKWLKSSLGVDITSRDEKYYETVTSKLKSDFESSTFWENFAGNFPEFNDEYFINTGYPLMREIKPAIIIKPYESIILKSYRKNILTNKNWPNPPQSGWIIPENWFGKINDIVRTLIEVKYLDGVEFMIGKIKNQCELSQIPCNVFLEARDEGYYAAHIYIKQNFEIPQINWDTARIDVSVELQITTQLQEVIRRLLHEYYENKRSNPKEDAKWQWDYKSNEFSANYLGHILHYVEGMIMELRDKPKRKETI